MRAACRLGAVDQAHAACRLSWWHASMSKKSASSLPHDQRETFPIVGIGASAGGLEALDQFLKNVPAESGFAFVIVQHLDPTHYGMMAELLQRATKMRVAQVEDRTQVLPDCVYRIPPNADLSLLHGVLHLLEPSAPHGLRLPIDFFFRSLAADLRDRSIGVVLSGMGIDGTLGLKAIERTGRSDSGSGTQNGQVRWHTSQRSVRLSRSR